MPIMLTEQQFNDVRATMNTVADQRFALACKVQFQRMNIGNIEEQQFQILNRLEELLKGMEEDIQH